MDQKKIGRFIAALRKDRKLTQLEIAQMLCISEKTVSKWECGNGLPEVVYMEPLCNILGITVNELLVGEHLHVSELLNKLDMSRIELMRQLEFEELKFRIYKLYGFEIDSVEISENGAGSLTYFVQSYEQRYVVKYASDNEMNHPEAEPMLCEFLRENGIPASEFIENIHGQVISVDENGRRFHVQKHIDGIVYKYNEAPEFLMKKAPELLAEIHEVLKGFENLPEGIGESFLRYRKPENMLEAFEASLQTAFKNGDKEIAEEISSVIEIIKRFPKYTLDASKFTYGNTHGDYMISQLICGENSINGIIDWTTACRHPLIWEVVRSYIFMAPECKRGIVDINKFEHYLKVYLKKGKLNKYDIENAGRFFFYFLSVCDFYGQYYQSMARNRYIYLEQARLSRKMLSWFDRHISELDARLKRLADEL